MPRLGRARATDEARSYGRRASLLSIGVGLTAITAYGASYFARGFLAGSNRLTIYALLIICESVARTAFPAAVALGIASGQTAVAMGIVAAPTLSLIVVPFAFLRRFGGT